MASATADLAGRIERTTGSRPQRLARLGGGCVDDVARAELADGRRVVVKAGSTASRLDVEGLMLAILARAGLPVPGVIHAEPGLLVMDWIETRGGLTAAAQEHAADLLAALHAVAGPAFGFTGDDGRRLDTLIGGLDQPNPPERSWLTFFRNHRLLHTAGAARDSGRLPKRIHARIERLAARLGEWIDEPRYPSLIHGDMWGGNVLCRDGRIAAFVDPAIYWADPEIELAFSTLFATFGDPFFRRYDEQRPISPGFFEARRDIYNLYPLLVHVRLFGGPYVPSVERTLDRFGC